MKKVIILEDEQFIRKSLVLKFTKLTDYNVVFETDNGKEVVNYLQRKPVDLLVTDINMPIMDGFDVIEEIRGILPNLRIVIISGYDDFSYVQRGIRLAVNDYLLKPIKDDDITQLQKRIDGDTTSEITSSLANQINLFIQKYYYLNNMTVESISEDLGYSKEYLSRKYKESYNISIYKKIVDLRISKAKELLIQYPTMDIQIVGEKVGYDDRYHFSKLFKQRTSYSPSDYRIKILNKTYH